MNVCDRGALFVRDPRVDGDGVLRPLRDAEAHLVPRALCPFQPDVQRGARHVQLSRGFGRLDLLLFEKPAERIVRDHARQRLRTF